MNKIYKSIKNKVTGNSVVVSELTKGNKKAISAKIIAVTTGLLISTSTMAGENLTYTGSEPLGNIDIEVFQTGGLANYTYFGASKSSANDNNINVNYDSSLATSNPALIMGGFADNNGANNNVITFNNGSVRGLIAAVSYGSDIKQTLANNHIIINGGTVNDLALAVFASKSTNGINVINNSVVLNGGTLNAATYDRALHAAMIYNYGGDNFASGNNIYINNTTIGDGVTNMASHFRGAVFFSPGQYGDSTSTLVNNNAYVNNSTVNYNFWVYAGATNHTNYDETALSTTTITTITKNNTANINNSTLNIALNNSYSYIYGATVSTASKGTDTGVGHINNYATDNIANISNTNINSNGRLEVAGAMLRSNIYSSGSSVVAAGYNYYGEGNTVNINNTTMQNASTHAKSITLAGSLISSLSGNVYLKNNKLNINDTTITSAGNVRLAGSLTDTTYFSKEAIASGNTVNLVNLQLNTSGSASNIITGGYIESNYYSGWTASGNPDRLISSGNTVTLNNVGITSSSIISGGHIYYRNGTGATGQDVTLNATNNTINIITGGYNLDLSKADIYGGYLNYTMTGSANLTTDLISGNTLNIISNAKDTTINSTQNFENYTFYAGTNIINKDILLSVTTPVSLDYISPSDSKTVKDVNVTLKEIAMSSRLTTGDYITLIDNATNTNSSTTYINGLASKTQQGIGTLYDTIIKLDGTNLNAYFGAGHATAQSKSFFEGKLAGLTFANQGADLVLGHGIKNALNASQNSSDVEAFAAISGGKSRYDTGSHINVRGVSLMSGFSKSINNLMIGGFVEGGWGNYDSHNSFNTHSVKGDGSTNYYGIGALANYQLDTNSYLNAAIRVGRVKTDFKSGDFLSGDKNRISAHYNSQSTYISTQLGGGYILTLDEKSFFDFNAHYLWTYQGSDSVSVKTGDRIKFDAINSHRLRAESRYTYKIKEIVQPYLGVAYEYEFNGKSKGSINGYHIQNSPDLKGGTAIFEIGSKSEAIIGGLSMDVSAKGYTGVRKGASAQLTLNYSF